MILFIVYIEPLFIRFERVTTGYALKAPILGGPRNVNSVAVRENLEGFVDDAKVVLINDEEFIIVNATVAMFEAVSGAILNRSNKSKVMGLGVWKGRETWPLQWLKSEPYLKIFGFIMYPDFKVSMDANWNDQLKKFKNTLFSWSSRVLDTLSERAEVLGTFALSRLYYRAQVLPLSSR